MSNCCNKSLTPCQPDAMVAKVYSDFKAIIIPTSLGDSKTGNYAPAVGAYKNAIVTYKADGHSYIYDDKGQYMLLSTGAPTWTVDDALDPDSKNPVENAVVTDAVTTLEAGVSANTESITSLGHTVANHTTAISTLSSDVHDNAQAIDSLEGDVDTLEGTVDTMGGDLTALTGRVGDAEGDITGLTTDLGNLTNVVDGLVAAGGEPNVIDTVKRNGVALTVTNKAVDITVPTLTSDLTNDSGYVNTSDMNTYIQSYLMNSLFDSTVTVKDSGNTTIGSFSLNQSTNATVIIPAATASAYGLVKVDTALDTLSSNPVTNSAVATAIGNISTISYEVVSQLPTTGSPNKIYLVYDSVHDYYDQWMYVSGSWVHLGTSAVDLSN